MYPNIVRTGKRMYPVTERPAIAQPMQQSNHESRRQGYSESVPIFHSPHQFAESFSKLSLINEPSALFKESSGMKDIKRYDVPLLGSPPLVEDLQLPMPTPRIPSSVT